MLAKRVIPCLDCDFVKGKAEVVKGVKFKKLVSVGKPWELAEKYYKEGADEIVFLDVSASKEGRENMIEIVRKTTRRVFVPITVGGGLSSVEDAKAVCETITRGERTFKDLLELISKAKKFQKWLAGKEPDCDLLREYYKEVTAGSWVDKLPAKVARWSIFTGIGLVIDALGGAGIGTAAGLTVSAGDALILDSIIGGWKPNHFIDNELMEFVKK